MIATIACPFCQTSCPLVADKPQPLPLIGYGDIAVYTCPQCGAVASPSGYDLWGAGTRLEQVEAKLASILAGDRGAARVEIDYVMRTNPPMLILWARRRDS